jgi:hypothetical protein
VGTVAKFSCSRVLRAQMPCNPVTLCRDLRSGGLYRYIVAGAPGGREVYMVPAYKTFEEIEKVLGSVERVC